MRCVRPSAYALVISLLSIACGPAGGSGRRLPWQKDTQTHEDDTQSPPTSTSDAPPIAQTDAPEFSDSTYRATLTNLDGLVADIQARRWQQGNHCEGKTIAIFDNGFAGLEYSKGVRLPADLDVESAPGNPPASTPHGTKLAEVIWALCTGSTVYSPARPGPRLKLFNTNGYTNFAHAIEQVVASPVDIVLYSQVWEFGGNFNGKGFINELVNRATNAGVLWVNASGNYGQAAWQGPIAFNATHSTVKLPHETQYVRLVVNENATPVKITAAWNDFTDLKSYKTTLDLDLILEDSRHQEIAASRLIQDGQDHGGAQGYSSYAREQIITTLDPGIYFLKVMSRTPEKFSASSRLRLAADGKDVAFIDQTPEGSIMIPADNASVLTIGASDVTFSSEGLVTGSTRHKPEALAPSMIRFDNDLTFAGSSSAAAVAVAMIALYETRCGTQDHSGWIRKIQSGAFGRPEAGDRLPTLKLPLSGRCL